MKLLATHEVSYIPELYQLVDALNKTLKDKKLIVGLSKKDDKTMQVSIYEIVETTGSS